MAKCKYCQAELPENTTVCPACGKDNKEEKKMTPGKTALVVAAVVVLAVILFSRRMVKARGFRAWQIFLWLLIGIAIGGAGYMEYYVQRRGNEALFAYSVMSGCLLFVILLTLLIRFLAVRVEKKYHGTDD